MTNQVKRVISMGLHPHAECVDCDWSKPHSNLTREAAKTHVKETGHDVVVETVSRDIYRLVES